MSTSSHVFGALCAILCLVVCACAPEPAADDEEVTIVVSDPGGRDGSVVEDMADLVVVQDMEPRDMSEPDRGVVSEDLGEWVDGEMSEEMDEGEDLAAPVLVFEDLGSMSVQSLFPGAQPGQTSAAMPLQMYYSAALDVYVGLDGATGWGEREVRQTFEALTAFRALLPGAYVTLFEASRSGDPSALRRPRAASWTNTNEVAAFVVLSNTFQGQSAPVMASNFYSLGTPQGGSVYRNVPFLNVRPDVIEGAWRLAGPQLVYPQLTRQEARDRYMKEGLADSLLHERIHAYISQFYAHDELFSALRSGAYGCEHNLEELMVKRTLDAIYAGHPELFSMVHRDYWSRDRELLAQSLAGGMCEATYGSQGLLDGPLFTF